MQAQRLQDFLLSLFDYATMLADKIGPDEPESSNYFLTLIYIEDLMDSYGRGLLRESMRETTGNPVTDISEANTQLELLRERIHQLAQQHTFDDQVRQHLELLSTKYNLNLRA